MGFKCMIFELLLMLGCGLYVSTALITFPEWKRESGLGDSLGAPPLPNSGHNWGRESGLGDCGGTPQSWGPDLCM